MKKTLHTMLTAAAFTLSAKNNPVAVPQNNTDKKTDDDKKENAVEKNDNSNETQE